jgi:hypothetical protein
VVSLGGQPLGGTPYAAEVDHPVPIEGHRRRGDASGFGFIITFDRIQRSRERMRHPRPLTESEREVILKAMAPVLRDLEVSGAIVPDVRYEAHADEGRDGREGVHAWIKGDDTSGWDVWTPTEESSPAEQVWWLGQQVQEWEIEELWHEGRSTTWPECPEHPNSHPLEPGIDGGDTAVWRCPISQHISCAIGELGSGE